MIDREWTMVVAIKFRLRSLCILERAVQLHDVVCVAWRVRSPQRGRREEEAYVQFYL